MPFPRGSVIAVALVGWSAMSPAGWQLPTGAFIGTDLVPESNQRWDRVAAEGWHYLRRASSKDDEIVLDPEAPFSPPGVLRIVFTPDMPRDHEPSVHWMPLERATEVHAVWWFRLSANWTASPAGGGKIAFLHAAPDGAGQVYSNIGGSRAPHRIDVNTEWTPYGQRVWKPNKDETRIVYDRWYRVDWYMKWPPAVAASTGVLRWWVDGVLNGEYTDVRFPVGGAGFQQFEFAPTRQLPPRDEEHMYIDHTAVSVR